jgi:hypothetical protein
VSKGNPGSLPLDAIRIEVRIHGKVKMTRNTRTSSHPQRVAVYENTGADSPNAYTDQREDYASMKDVCY